MIRKELVGTVFGIEFIQDSEIQPDDVMLVIDAHLVSGLGERRFGEMVAPPVMTRAAIATMRGDKYLKGITKVAGSKISMRLVPLKKSKARA